MLSAKPEGTLTASHSRMVIVGSTVGTLFEWYDFFLYGAMASVFSKQFFGALSGTSAYLFALIAFGVGFAVRPLGALIFGRLGDKIGRKYTFLITIVLMGGSTFLVGLLPTYAQAGLLSPVLLLALRVVQGLGLGGEYGGAAIYVAEHAPSDKRGRDTSWIQMTGAGGTILSLAVVFACRRLFGDAFDTWAWRLPFLLSGIMLLGSIYIRTKLHESPVFEAMKAEGTTSKRPLHDAFASWTNVKAMLIALFGLVMGVSTVLYTGQTYVFFFLNRTLHVDIGTTSLIVGTALALCLPVIWCAGAISDRIGRKKVILTGCALAALTFMPLFKAVTHYANPALELATANSPVVIKAPADSCHFQIHLLGNAQAQSDCDRIKDILARAGVPYTTQEIVDFAQVQVSVGGSVIANADAAVLEQSLIDSGYPKSAADAEVNRPMLVLIIFVMCCYFAMVYAPLAAALVEMFPAKVRYTAMSLPYHLGNGIVGGFYPAVAFAMVTASGDIYFGVWYPISFAVLSVIVGGIWLHERRASESVEPGIVGAATLPPATH